MYLSTAQKALISSKAIEKFKAVRYLIFLIWWRELKANWSETVGDKVNKSKLKEQKLIIKAFKEFLVKKI